MVFAEWWFDFDIGGHPPALVRRSDFRSLLVQLGGHPVQLAASYLNVTLMHETA